MAYSTEMPSILGRGRCKDPADVIFRETAVDDRLRCFRRIPLAPGFFAQPVAKFRLVFRCIFQRAEVDPADELAVDSSITAQNP
jgi:hypothetical protein